MTEGERFALIHFTSRAGMAAGFMIGGWQFLASLGLDWRLIAACFFLTGPAVHLFRRFQPSQAKIMHDDWKKEVAASRKRAAAKREQEELARHAWFRLEHQRLLREQYLRRSQPPRDILRESIQQAGRMKEDGWMLGDHRR